jgi:hypothetical protein
MAEAHIKEGVQNEEDGVMRGSATCCALAWTWDGNSVRVGSSSRAADSPVGRAFLLKDHNHIYFQSSSPWMYAKHRIQEGYIFAVR